MTALLTFTTDFGADSPYVAQMKAAVLQRIPAATLIDVCHTIPPQNVIAGSVVMRDCCPRFPASAVHVGVIDPGVGSARDIIACQLGEHYYVGPDNGLLHALSEEQTLRAAVRVDQGRFDHATTTFHGRDIMAPVAAEIACGRPLEDLGEVTGQVRPPAQASRLERSDDRVVGQVEWVDDFGNLVTNIPGSWLESSRTPVLRIGEHSVKGLVRYYAAAEVGRLVALIGSNGRLEFAVVNGSAASRLQLEVGASVEVRWVRSN